MEFLELFLTFFMMGAVTFGGGYAMLPMMQEQVLLHWGQEGLIDEKLILDMVAISESTPGPFAVNMATFVGATVGAAEGGPLLSALGSISATMGVVLPSFIVILIVAKCYEKFKTNKIVKGCMTGLKPAVVGLIGGAVFDVVLTVFYPEGSTLAVFAQPDFYISLALFGTMLVLALKKVHPIIIICISAAVGIIIGYLPI